MYIELPAWEEEISQIRSFAKLPEAAQVYVAASYAGMITCASNNGHELRTIPYLSLLGVGPDPDEVIIDTPNPSVLFDIAAKAGIFTEQNLAEFSRVHGYVKSRFEA